MALKSLNNYFHNFLISLKQLTIKEIFSYLISLTGVLALFLLIKEYGFNIQLKKNAIFINIVIIAQQFIAATFISSLIFDIYSNKKQHSLQKSIFLLSFAGIIFLIFLLEFIFTIYDFKALRIFITEKRFSGEGLIFTKILFVLMQIFSFIYALIVVFVKWRDKWLYLSLAPTKIYILSFVMIIIVGTLLLKLPTSNTGLKWIDSFFTATSAICVTGLSPIDVSATFNTQGQFIMILLMQIGGLGIITLTALAALPFQRVTKLREHVILKEVLDDDDFSSVFTILKSIVGITFAVEFLGAVVFFISWTNIEPDTSERFFYAIFHAVSAYCNAGYSNYPGGMENLKFASHAPTLITVMILIIFGGIGFYTMYDILNFSKGGPLKKKRYKLETKIILYSTVVLIFGGAFIIWVLQYQEWKELSVKQQLLNAFFTSVVTRTAGFSNVSPAGLLTSTSMIIILWMYIGAAPNSTAGGIKIPTAVTMISALWAFMRGKQRVDMGWHTINMTVIRRCTVVIMVSGVLIFTSVFLLSITEDLKKHSIFDLFYESVSAFATVGLSRNVTPDLSTEGKLIIIFLMFFGRIGVFTMATLVGEEKQHAKYKFADTNIMVG